MLSFGSLHTNIATGKNSLSKAFGRQGHETGLRFDSSWMQPKPRIRYGRQGLPMQYCKNELYCILVC